MYQNLHPNLRAYVNCVLNHEFGIENSKAEVAAFTENRHVTRITASVLYCRERLTWELVFKLDDLFSPPEVIAIDTKVEELVEDNVQEILPSLGKWCPERENCLLVLLLELIDFHLMSQVKRLKANEDLNRQMFEYDILTSIGIVSSKNLELSVTSYLRGTCVSFHLPLTFNLEDLPLKIKDGNQTTAFLTVTYRIPGQTIVELKFSSHLQKLIGKVEVPILPGDVTLFDYVPVLQEKINHMIDEFRHDYELKEQFFAAVASRLGSSVLNADSENFSRVAFLVIRQNRKFLYLIEIPFRFPKDKPSVKALTDEFCQAKEVKFQFDPTWTPDKMAMEMLKGVLNSKIR